MSSASLKPIRNPRVAARILIPQIEPAEQPAAGQTRVSATPPRKYTNPWWILRAIFISAVLIVLVVLAFSHEVWPRLSKCTTSYCRQMAGVLREALDLNVEPCDNFYQFVCGRWRNRYRKVMLN